MVASLSVHAAEIDDPQGRFHVVFPDADGWEAVREDHPNPQSIQWTARHQGEKTIFLFSVVDFPLPKPDAPFSEHAQDWRKSVVASADSIDSERFTRLGGVEAFEIAGRITNAASTYHFLRYMMQCGDITYQVTVVSGDAISRSDPEIDGFLSSIEVKK